MTAVTTVTRSFEFDYGHRVLGHGGKCRHLHGHRGKAMVTVSAPQLDDLSMVIDFSAIKEKIGGWIDSALDHNLLLNVKDPQLNHLMKTEERKPFVMPSGNPTAENISRLIYYKSKEILGEDFKMVRVRLYETPNCFADYSE